MKYRYKKLTLWIFINIWALKLYFPGTWGMWGNRALGTDVRHRAHMRVMPRIQTLQYEPAFCYSSSSGSCYKYIHTYKPEVTEWRTWCKFRSRHYEIFFFTINVWTRNQHVYIPQENLFWLSLCRKKLKQTAWNLVTSN